MADVPPTPEELTLQPLGFGHLAAVLDLGHRVYDTDAMPYTGWPLSAVAGPWTPPTPPVW
ncbi:hypothetical protein AV521_02875 [Streptomyces sp. IMTB 2501]|uniref:hypothetical protein n=1 Tax=Streptomyces sp. IMTB 2501 TaxID=1776340 RepID=UPI00097ACAF9|nr:hypothetical protein [Streptomyces sp. IMTB 2501]OLZ74586.1 hypothetical protein AV521_02875 [Streptomyces sp. IMTB 2501]